MKKECEVIRDILPLYADDACSDASREIIEEHLKECQDCAAYLEQIRASEAEDGLKEERKQVIENQARRFKRRSAAVGSATSAVFMIPILIYLVVNLISGGALSWFFVMVAGMLVAASLIVVPIIAPRDKLFWTFCAFTGSLMVLLAVCSLYTHGTWFLIAASASLFGLSVVFLPFVIKAKPLEKLVEGRKKSSIVLAVDAILFGNMMSMISLNIKSFFLTAVTALLTIAAIGLLAFEIIRKGRDK
uniref:Anti-sigma-YlaC factor ylaD n=1 Tax=uncultured bacterium Contig575 TaxID=1393592 RepID=W0FLN2_9BACT|nr:anti-sigma-YlaC factor ylaD [uncultured bacterium Contig575]